MRDLAIFCSLTLLSSIVTAQPVCPEGTTFASYTDDFKSMNTDFWIPTQGMAEDSVVYDAEKGGATFKIREKMLWAIINSTTMWQPPLNMSIQMQTSGKPGTVSQVAFLGDNNRGHEIDLEVLHNSYNLPIWKPRDGGIATPLSMATDQSKELQVILGDATAPKDNMWKVKHDGWQPSKMLTYSMQWRHGEDGDGHVAWWVGDGLPGPGDEARVTYRTTPATKDFPGRGDPLPLHLGLWGTSPDADWAGRISWDGVESYELKVASFRIIGCRSDELYKPSGVPVS